MTTRNKRYRRALWKRGVRDCVRCGLPITTYTEATVDHVVAMALGGPNRLENVALAHYECNRKHGWEVAAQLREAALTLP